MTSVYDYLDGVDDDSRAAFERVRAVATEVVPDAAQGRSYGTGRAAQVSKGTLRFTPGAPLPDDVVRDVVAWRRDEIGGSAG